MKQLPFTVVLLGGRRQGLCLQVSKWRVVFSCEVEGHPSHSAAAETNGSNKGRVGGHARPCLSTPVDKPHGAKNGDGK